MAISTVWSNFVNGAKGLTVRNAINTFNTNILANMISTEGRVTANESAISTNTTNIGTNTTNITALDGRVTTAEGTIVANQGRLDTLEEVGIVVLSGNAIAPQTIGLTPSKVVLFSAKNVEAGVGVTGDVALNRATATLTGIFKVRFEAFVSYASNVSITWRLYKNGAPYGDGITLSGQGADVFPITLITSDSFVANDYIELYAFASASTSLTVVQTNGTLEKTIF